MNEWKEKNEKGNKSPNWKEKKSPHRKRKIKVEIKIGKSKLEFKKSKMSDRDRVEKELKWEIRVQREKGNKSPNRIQIDVKSRSKKSSNWSIPLQKEDLAAPIQEPSRAYGHRQTHRVLRTWRHKGTSNPSSRCRSPTHEICPNWSYIYNLKNKEISVCVRSIISSYELFKDIFVEDKSLWLRLNYYTPKMRGHR